MNYYTLTTKGKAWWNNKAPDPPKYKEVLSSLAELIAENELVPRVPTQIAHNISAAEDVVIQGLKYLKTKGYVKQTKPPQPSEKGETPKLRIRSEEDLAFAHIRSIESQKKYTKSTKGKVVHSTYERSDKGKDKNRRYRESDRGKLTHKTYRLRRRLRELKNFLLVHPEQEAEINPYIIDVEARLVEVEARLASLKEEYDNNTETQA